MEEELELELNKQTEPVAEVTPEVTEVTIDETEAIIEEQEPAQVEETKITEPEQPVKEPETVYEWLDSPLDNERKIELGKLLAETMQDIKTLEDRKKDFDRDINDQIKGKQAEAAGHANSFLNGFDKKKIACRWVPNDPEPGLCSLYRNDTNEFVRIRNMNLFDAAKAENKSIDKSLQIPDASADVEQPADNETIDDSPLTEEEIKNITKQLYHDKTEIICRICGCNFIATVEECRGIADGSFEVDKFVCNLCEKNNLAADFDDTDLDFSEDTEEKIDQLTINEIDESERPF